MTDWNELRVRYVSGKMSLKQLAADSGVSYSQVSKHASREEWSRQRKLFGKKVANKSLAHAQARAQARAQANLERAMEVTEGLLKVAVTALEDQDQFRRYLVLRTEGSSSETVEEVFQKVDTKAIKELTESVDRLTALLRTLHDVPDEAERQRRTGEKLKQEKLREEIRRLKEENKRAEEERQAAGEQKIIRFETEEEYLARTGDTETEREAADLSE